MPYQPLPLAQLITQTQQDISQRLPGSQPGVNETTLNAIAYALAGCLLRSMSIWLGFRVRSFRPKPMKPNC
ncbi:putative gp47 domain protein [Escherichia coli 2-460-02_S3_C1]|nr:putative gp47 domain protein [Escherichia coli 2-460-02_S3_C1]KDY56044.1 putative gp47 domain protein [Escherichia coli 2-460-02_S3_C2]